MSVISEKQFSFNYGWDHFWCDPKHLKHLGIREFIKGPFRRLKLVSSVPFVTRCQQGGTSVVFREGIPDCWAEYLTQKLRFPQKYLRNYELMHKEDVDIVPHLRKYRLYLGQGIPDPWTAYPYNSEIFSYNDTELRKRLKNKKEERCLCCEREYLFECPDTCVSNANHCSCKDCHGKNPSTSEPTEKCRCSEIFHNWVLENSRIKHRKGNSGDALSSPEGSHSETEAEGRHLKDRNKFVAFCECYDSLKCCDCNDNSGLGGGDHESNEKKFKFSNRFLKQQSKVYFCPNLKTFCRKKALETNKNFVEAKTSVSKEIQTEIQTIKSSKTVQTEKPETKIQPKCTCRKKSFGCCVLFNQSCLKAGCPTAHSIPSFYCSSSFTPSPAFVCPYSVANHFAVQKHCKNETGEVKRRHKKKNQLKERDSEVGSNLEFDQQEEKGDAAPKSKINEDSPQHEPAEAHDSLKCNKNIYNSQAPSTTFDHLKYLADYKLKGFLQQEENFPGTHKNKFPHQITGADSRFINFCRGNSSLNSLRREGVSQDRFKPFVYYKPRYSESSFPENKFNLRKSNPLNIRRFSSCDQATMTPNREPENLESEALIKESISRESVDSDELKADGFVGNQEVTKAFGKRRKLLRNRKRRRKLVASILGYQDSLTKPTKRTGNFKNEVRLQGTSQDYGHTKKMSNPNFTSSACHLNFGENCGSRFTEMRIPEFSFGRNSQEISKKQFGKLTSQIQKKC